MRERSVLLLLVCSIAGPAAAVDGVIEINQTVAIETGIDAGDAPGFPVTITQPGSYRLTGNLTVSAVLDPAPDAIRITTDDVTLDLNGFAIRCTRVILTGSCSALGGTGDGIEIGSGARAIHVHSGAIRGFPQHGINATQSGTSYTLESLRVSSNGVNGLFSAGHGQVYRSQFLDNGQYGIEARAFNDLILDVFTTGNGVAGLHDTASDVAVGRSQFDDALSGVGTTALVDCVMDGSTQRCP